MLENILVSVAVSFACGLPLSAYASIIVVRYFAFTSAIDQARTIVLKLDQEWQYRYLNQSVPDPNSPSGERTVYMSNAIASNGVSWELTLVGLQLKELGHWEAATAVDSIWMELDQLREGFLAVSTFVPDQHKKDITEFIADWHRTLSRQRPNYWHILRPWSRRRYEHMSCIETDESGAWKEKEPDRKATE